MAKTIYMGSDHAGLSLKNVLIPALQADGMTAGHRHQPGLQVDIPGLGPVNVGPQTPAFVDPEWDRAPGTVTDDHYFDAEHHH